MRVHGLRKKWVAAFVGVAVIGTFVTVAFGSLGVGFHPTTLVTGNFNDAVHLNSDWVKF